MTQTRNMTSGSCAGQIFLFGLPLLAGNILQQLYNLVDTVVVGRGIGMNALASVGVTGSVNFLVLGFILGMAQGVTILVSQAFGAGDFRRLRQSIAMSLILNLAVGAVIMVISLLGVRQLLVWMNSSPEILEDAVLYIQLIFWGIPVSLAYNFLAGILRAVGDSRNPLTAMIIAFIVNTILDVLFVISFHMGVADAALATVTAQGISALYCLWCFLRLKQIRLQKQDWTWNGLILKQSFLLSLPVAIMNSITAVGVIFLAAAINAYDAAYVAAYSAAQKVIVILEQISSTFGMACGTFVGQNLGAGKYDRIRRGVRQTNWMVIAMNLGTGLLMAVCGRGLIQLMVGEESLQVIDIATHCLVFLSWLLVPLGILWVYRCSLQSMSDTVWPMCSGILEFAARTIFIMLLPKLFGFDGVLAAEVSAWISAAILLVTVYVFRMRTSASCQPAEQNLLKTAD
ncbi:MATE family efflux transporter [uncultured Faecalibaculum sp.]|uniref:MATE family efflux transporter n=1 Tax=uncultured Faecalibaculum sp. TaxID=1729681 RepID=UPI002628450F|nr:MATE family efflux transporter [uncultured Faecalibaculum sp.]